MGALFCECSLVAGKNDRVSLQREYAVDEAKALYQPATKKTSTACDKKILAAQFIPESVRPLKYQFQVLPW